MPFAFLFFAGCWTFDKSEYPAVALTSAPEGKDVTVEVAGFDASQTMYVPTYGMTTVVEPVAYGRCHRRVFWGTTTYATTTYLPQVATTAQFRDQAVQALERAGFLTRAPNAAYRVEVVFSGPFATDGETLEMLCWSVFSLFTAERGIQTWQAQLRIHDKATGRLLLEHRLSQQYTATAWGLIPFFSPAAAGTTEAWAMKAWCLSALTDRAVAEATAFLSRR
jgi:hypothetical protein